MFVVSTHPIPTHFRMFLHPTLTYLYAPSKIAIKMFIAHLSSTCAGICKKKMFCPLLITEVLASALYYHVFNGFCDSDYQELLVIVE